MDINDNYNAFPFAKRIKHVIKDCRVKYRNATKLAQELGALPAENEGIYIWIQGNFIFGDFIIQYICENELEVEELSIITLSIGHETIEALQALIENGWVKKIDFLISDYFLRTEKVKQTKSLKLLEKACCECPTFKVYSSNTHQKIMLMSLADGRKIVFHGSANFKGSQNFEQLMIDNNSILYDFNYEYFNHLKNKTNGIR